MKNKISAVSMWFLSNPARIQMVICTVVIALVVASLLVPGVVRADSQIIGTGH